MKGVPGSTFAVGLSIVGAFCNWMYLANKGRDLEQIAFIGIAEDVRINVGDRFKEGQFVRISIPREAVLRGNLEKAAYLWDEIPTVVGMAATKSYASGEILLRQHLHTPPETDIKKLLAADEVVLWLPVDTRTFVPSLVNAGDNVSFVVPQMGRNGPAGADDGSGARPSAAGTEIVGPFRILALGNRLGTQEVLRAYGVTPTQENVMA